MQIDFDYMKLEFVFAISCYLYTPDWYACAKIIHGKISEKKIVFRIFQM